MSEPTTVQAALCAVKKAIGAVGKDGENKAQGFRFRGVDAVVNAAAPHLNEHGVVVAPRVLSFASEQYETRNGAKMRSLTAEVEYTFTGPAGDQLVCSVLAESSDSGDKAAPKMMSVAYRTALLQVLNLPTDDPDPDESAHERAIAEPSDLHGWSSADEHNRRLESIVRKVRLLPAEAQAQIRGWWDEKGLSKPLTPDEMDAYQAKVDEVDALVTADGEAPF